MIAVIADDLTGAAELGGIGLQYGLRTEIHVSVPAESMAELVIISTDTRSVSEADAIAKTELVVRDLAKLQPAFIFKKIDSVLRGHVLAELENHMQVSGMKRALIVPANPALGRTIIDSTYLLHGAPIHKSSFSRDPEFAIVSSHVADMLRVEKSAIHVAKVADNTLPEEGIVIGEATDAKDLAAWAERVDERMVVAGASGFFMALLGKMYGAVPAQNVPESLTLSSPALYVCGSNFSGSHDAVRAVKDAGGPVSYMPVALLLSENNNDAIDEKWRDEIIGLLQVSGKAIMAIDPLTTAQNNVSAADLREKTAHAIQAVFRQMAVPELILEGGSTAAAVLRKLDRNSFVPTEQPGAGVIRMRAGGAPQLHVTLKPGSYSWTPDVWPFARDGKS